MARSIRRLIEEPGLAEYLSRNARTFAEAFDWPAILPMWENVFGGVLS
jgi:glycosyltransferase involved in cell wall biosynthesis